MFRRYNRSHSRFDQPDPYDGSYDLTNPQSFNRYAYVQNDPVNFIDPFGLDPDGALGGILGDVAGMGPGTSTVTIPISWDDPISRHGGPSGDGSEWVTLAVIDPTSVKKGYSAEQIKAAVASCVSSLFKVVLVDFQASSRARNGVFNGTNMNVSNPDNQQVSVVNEVHAYTANQLSRMHEKFEGLKPNSVGRLAGLTIGFTDISGNITGYSPYRNFTASDVKSNSSTLSGVNAITDTQIWELGNSLGFITHTAIAGEGQEEGPMFEDCVRKQLESTH
jgi:uncharacterized protein RhaS with RHS repeats